MTLCESIRALRRERSMTQEQLAEAMSVSAAAVSKWENGQSVPDIAVLTALADFFEVSLDALVGYTVHSCRREEAVERTITGTRRYVRRQRSWFNRDPRITWLDAAAAPATRALDFLR